MVKIDPMGLKTQRGSQWDWEPVSLVKHWQSNLQPILTKLNLLKIEEIFSEQIGNGGRCCCFNDVLVIMLHWF